MMVKDPLGRNPTWRKQLECKPTQPCTTQTDLMSCICCVDSWNQFRELQPLSPSISIPTMQQSTFYKQLLNTFLHDRSLRARTSTA